MGFLYHYDHIEIPEEVKNEEYDKGTVFADFCLGELLYRSLLGIFRLHKVCACFGWSAMSPECKQAICLRMDAVIRVSTSGVSTPNASLVIGPSASLTATAETVRDKKGVTEAVKQFSRLFIEHCKSSQGRGKDDNAVLKQNAKASKEIYLALVASILGELFVDLADGKKVKNLSKMEAVCDANVKEPSRGLTSALFHLFLRAGAVCSVCLAHGRMVPSR